jgi:hypothetical protein
MTSEYVDQRSTVICPECGTSAQVALNRREAQDFCARCDFPLFWTPADVIRDGGEGSGENLRRLPGTAGRVTVAAVPCPTCAEANPVGAETCLRCGGPMVLITAPEPIPVIAPPPPPPAPEPTPEPTGIDWYWWLVGGATLVALIALIVVLVAR